MFGHTDVDKIDLFVDTLMSGRNGMVTLLPQLNSHNGVKTWREVCSINVDGTDSCYQLQHPIFIHHHRHACKEPSYVRRKALSRRCIA